MNMIEDRGEGLIVDKLGNLIWKTKEGELIRVRDMKDSHLRNAALFLMGMGYTPCAASNDTRIKWLGVLRMEWERRQYGKHE